VRVLDNLDPQVHSGRVGEPAVSDPNAEFQRGDRSRRTGGGSALDGIEVVYHQAAAVGVGPVDV